MRKIILTGAVWWAIGLPSTALADSLIYTPVIFEGNGNAYALFDHSYSANRKFVGYEAVRVGKAVAIARESTYKGVPGRLAIIDSKELETFLRTTFQPTRRAWIGLRYTCSTSTWTYSNGEVIPVNAYTHWHPTKWSLGGRRTIQCRGTGFSQAYFGAEDIGPYWAVASQTKAFSMSLVEYPLSEVELKDDAGDEATIDAGQPSNEPPVTEQP